MDDTRELLGFEDRRCNAMIAADIGALGRLLSDKLTWTHASAQQDTKESFWVKSDEGWQMIAWQSTAVPR